jgi:hypothetical protein
MWKYLSALGAKVPRDAPASAYYTKWFCGERQCEGTIFKRDDGYYVLFSIKNVAQQTKHIPELR